MLPPPQGRAKNCGKGFNWQFCGKLSKLIFKLANEFLISGSPNLMLTKVFHLYETELILEPCTIGPGGSMPHL